MLIDGLFNDFFKLKKFVIDVGKIIFWFDGYKVGWLIKKFKKRC